MTIEPTRSEEYTRLLEELRNSFVSAVTMAVKLYEQGKKDGLSNAIIRRDIESALDGIIKERRLREILPLELKRKYLISSDTNSALSVECIYAVSDTPGLEQITETDKFKVVDVSSLEPFKGAMRSDYGSFKEFIELCDTIKEVGLLQPIIVRPAPNNNNINDSDSFEQKYEVVAGVRRLFALRHLGVKTTPVIIRDLSDIEARVCFLVTNIHFEPLNEQEIESARWRITVTKRG